MGYWLPAVLPRSLAGLAGSTQGTASDWAQRTQAIDKCRSYLGLTCRYVLLWVLSAGLSACHALPFFEKLPAPTLADTYWRLTWVAGQPVSLPAGAREPYLLLTQNNRQIHGFTGCNDIDGQYQGNTTQLHFAAYPDAGLFCAGTPALARAYIDALKHTAGARINHRQLVLLDAKGHVLAKFQARLGH